MFTILTPIFGDAAPAGAAPNVNATATSAAPYLSRAIAANTEQQRNNAPGGVVRLFFFPDVVAPTAHEALACLSALCSACEVNAPLVFISHLDALGDRGGVIVEGTRAPTAATPALDLEEERGILSREVEHAFARLHHADRVTARHARVHARLLQDKAPTRGSSAVAAFDVELARERRSLSVSVLQSRARARGFRTGRGYLAALGECAMRTSVSSSIGGGSKVSVRFPPLGVARDPARDVDVFMTDENLALFDVVNAIEDGARRTKVPGTASFELLPVDDAVDALLAARRLLLSHSNASAPLGVVTALAKIQAAGARKAEAARLLTIERILEFIDLSARSEGTVERVLARVDVAPPSALLTRSLGKGFSLAERLAQRAATRAAKTALGRDALAPLETLVDVTKTSARGAITRTFGNGCDPFVHRDVDANGNAIEINADDDASTRSWLTRPRSSATTSSATTSATTRTVSGVVASGQRLRCSTLAASGYAPEVSWRRYMLDRHLPALEKLRARRLVQADIRVANPAYDTLVDLVTEVSRREKNRPALTRFEGDARTSLDYRDLVIRAEAIALRLIDAGIKRGDRVVLSGDNHPDWCLVSFGVYFAGATLVPLDPALSIEQAATVLKSARPALAILDAHARASFGALVDVTLEDSSPQAPANGVAKVRTLDLHLAAASGRKVDARARDTLDACTPSADDVASILFTSGTTGVPKGVELTHKNFTSLLASLGAVFDMHRGDRSLSLMPLHHTLEFSCGLLLPLSAGAEIHYLDELTADRLAFALKEGRITGMVCVPALWQLLERKMRSRVEALGPRLQTAFSMAMRANRLVQDRFGYDFGPILFKPLHDELGGNLRTLISGGAALPPDVHAFFAGIGLHLAEGYGLTESAPVLTVAEGGPGTVSGTVGRPIPGVDVRIDDANESGVGEVWARGPNIMRGYFENDDATRTTMSEDGWLRTGDLGRLDDGVLTLVGRAKDVVVTSSGENIYLDDTEARLGEIAGIAELTLLGVDDPRGGERLAFAYVAEDGVSAHDASAAVAKALNKLPETFRPQVVAAVVGPLPKTATRKVKRKDVVPLVERFLVDKAANTPQAGPALSAVRGAIAAATSQDVGALTSSTDLRSDLGFDSLLWVEVQDALEPIYGALDADALFACQTVGDVEVYLRSLRDGSSVEAGKDARTQRLGFHERGERGGAGNGASDGASDVERIRIPAPFIAPLRKALGVAQRDLYRTLFETEVSGRAYIPHNRATIVVANHTSHLDVGLVKFALGRYAQKLAPLAAKDYFFEGSPLKVAVVEQLTNLVAIERESGSGIAFEQARAAIKEGRVVLIFPEGTRRAEGTLGEFRPLVGRLALTCDVDVLPLHLGGAFEALPRGSFRPHARELSVRIGAPLSASAMRMWTHEQTGADAARTATGIIRDAVAALRDGDVLEMGSDGPRRHRAPHGHAQPTQPRHQDPPLPNRKNAP